MSGAEEGAIGGTDRDVTTDEFLFILQGTSQDVSKSLLQKELDKQERIIMT